MDDPEQAFYLPISNYARSTTSDKLVYLSSAQTVVSDKVVHFSSGHTTVSDKAVPSHAKMKSDTLAPIINYSQPVDRLPSPRKASIPHDPPRRQLYGRVWLCPVAYCKHALSDHGYVNLGNCENHIKADHAGWIADNPHWASMIRQGPRSVRLVPSASDGDNFQIGPVSRAPDLPGVTRLTVEAWLNKEHEELRQSFAPNPLRLQFDQEPTPGWT